MIELYNEDCFIAFDRIKRNSVDLVLCDLPFGVTSCDWDIELPLDEMWNSLFKLIKPTTIILLFGIEPFSSKLRMSNFKKYRYDLYWHKNLPTGFQFAKYQPMRVIENISVFYESKGVYNLELQPSTISDRQLKDGAKNGNGTRNKSEHNFGMNTAGGRTIRSMVHPTNLLKYNCVPRATGTLHPSQKPVELLQRLIRNYSNENDVVLDFTMGSGSTGVACQNENRHFIGIEKDVKHFNTAQGRLKLDD
jgi:DNA modification methylase